MDPIFLTELDVADALCIRGSDVGALVAAGMPFIELPGQSRYGTGARSIRRYELGAVQAWLASRATQHTAPLTAAASQRPTPTPARAPMRATTSTPTPRKKPTVTKQPDNYYARLDALGAELEQHLKAQGVSTDTINEYKAKGKAKGAAAAANSGTAPTIDPERAASCAALDRAFGGFTAQRPSTRFNPATQTLELGVGNPTFRPPTPAPQAKPVSAARSSGTGNARARGPHPGSDPRSEGASALDQAFGMSALVPGVRREGNSMVLGFFPGEPKQPAANGGTDDPFGR